MNRLHLALVSIALSGPACAQAPSQGSLNLLFDGDSISAGLGASQGHGLDLQTASAIGGAVELHNVSDGGRPVWQCLRLYPDLVEPKFDPTRTYNIIAFHAGDNDVAQGRDAQQTYAAFTAYVTAAHQQGWKVIVTTELRRFKFSASEQRELEGYNALLISNKAGADAVIDLNADPRLGENAHRTDPSLFTSDGIHPSDGGYSIIAQMLSQAVKRLSSPTLQR
jgi:lysophospholipase L1-like esterase